MRRRWQCKIFQKKNTRQISFNMYFSISKPIAAFSLQFHTQTHRLCHPLPALLFANNTKHVSSSLISFFSRHTRNFFKTSSTYIFSHPTTPLSSFIADKTQLQPTTTYKSLTEQFRKFQRTSPNLPKHHPNHSKSEPRNPSRQP